MTVRLAETVFNVQFETAEIAAEIVPRLVALETPPAVAHHTFSIDEEPDGYTVTRDAVRFTKEPLLTGARAQLLLELTRLATKQEEFAAVLHAGACGTRNSALVLAGPSHSGKSTLCAALMGAGWCCYSDDSAPLDRNFDVVAMPFALVLREPSLRLFPALGKSGTCERYGSKVGFLPSNISSDISSSGVPAGPVQALIFVDYKASAPPAELIPVEPFEALVALHECGFWVEHTQASIAAFLAWLTALPRYRLTYSSLNQAIDILTPLL